MSVSTSAIASTTAIGLVATLLGCAEATPPAPIAPPPLQTALEVLQPAPAISDETPEPPPTRTEPVEKPRKKKIDDLPAAGEVIVRGGPTDQGFALLGELVAPGTSTTLSWSPNPSFEATHVPVLVANGAAPGPTLCLTAAVHGDELNGIEVVRRVVHEIDPAHLAGTVIGVPIVNLQGFHRSTRYLPDRRDLNRFFPGNPTGSSASRIAHSLFNGVIRHCSALVDLHTGSFHRTNLPQLRADLTNESVIELTRGFGATVVLHSEGAEGTLRRAATDAGIPAVTLEAGEPLRLQAGEVEHGVRGIESLIGDLGMRVDERAPSRRAPVYYMSKWIRADVGGILMSNVDLGHEVEPGDLLGIVTDPITNDRVEILSPYDGRVLGMALNQVVHPGFAAFRVGIDPNSQDVLTEEADLENSEE